MSSGEALDALRDAQRGFEQIATHTPHLRGCDEPDDPGCARCIADSEAARAAEVIASLADVNGR